MLLSLQPFALCPPVIRSFLIDVLLFELMDSNISPKNLGNGLFRWTLIEQITVTFHSSSKSFDDDAAGKRREESERILKEKWLAIFCSRKGEHTMFSLFVSNLSLRTPVE